MAVWRVDETFSSGVLRISMYGVQRKCVYEPSLRVIHPPRERKGRTRSNGLRRDESRTGGAPGAGLAGFAKKLQDSHL